MPLNSASSITKVVSKTRRIYAYFSGTQHSTKFDQIIGTKRYKKIWVP